MDYLRNLNFHKDQSIARDMKEAILELMTHPWIKNIGKYQLPYIWDKVFVKSPEFKLE